MEQPHILLVTFPGQGHINPSLQFAKRLLSIGARVTFATSVSAFNRMAETPSHDGLSFFTYSDGYDDGFPQDGDANHYMSQIRIHGSETLATVIKKSREDKGTTGRPFTCVVYTVLIPWVAEVASALNIPSTLLWNQPASVFAIYFHYFNGYKDTIKSAMAEDFISEPIHLPGLPKLTGRDLPTFLDPSSAHTFALPEMQKQMEILDQTANPKVLVNTFDALELDALRAVQKFNLVGVGPLIPSAFLDGKDPSDTSFGADLFHGSDKEYIEWLNSKDESSVVYVSFGSLAVLSKTQKEEIAHGLLQSGYPFLWIIRSQGKEEEEELSCKEELERKGRIVPWCSQVEVLSHPSLGCFLTHCGWNSCLESLSSGVPMVAFPQWSDQWTNALLVQDVWKTGVRVNVNGQGMAERGEIKRCLELVMGEGETRQVMRRNAKEWKDLARQAFQENGPSDNNLRDFVNMNWQ